MNDVWTFCRAGGLRWCTAGLLLAALSGVDRPASAQIAGHADVKAAFVVTFPKFVDWPLSRGDEREALVIAVLGHDSLAAAVTDLARAKSVRGRPLVVKRLTPRDDPREAHLLFIGASEQPRIEDLLARLAGSGVLTVSDADRFCESGGIIGFRLIDDRVRFDVNLGRATESGLTVNSKLLALAGTVHTQKPPQERP